MKVSLFGIILFCCMLRCSAGFLAAEELPPIRLSPYVPSAARKYEGVQYQIAEPWSWQMFPDGLLYPAYLAGQQESRLGGVWNHEDDLGWIWDITLGGRAPFVRCGTQSGLFPEGVQIDLEGSVHLRLDMEHAMDMDANDFRFGLPISFSNKIWQIRTGYYHVSSHLGDERMIRMTNANQYHGRNNYYREAVIFGYAYRFTPSTRVYAEADYAVKRGEFTEPWHFQFGAEYSPRYPARGGVGTPFAAVNLLLLEEHNFDGNITVQTGWQWRGNRNQLFRVGVQYFSGISDQYEYIHKREQKIGLGIWYDF